MGAAATIQTFGDYARWHPHVHAIVADGLFRRNGTFHVMGKAELVPLAELFRAKVLSMLRGEGLIDEDFITMLLKWRHTSGFSVDNSVRIGRDDASGLTGLAQYIIRSPFSCDKIRYNAETGMVVYHSKMTHGKNKKNFAIFTAEEFIAAITQHIPDRSFQLFRYYGWYSNRMRGERARREQVVKANGEEVAGGGVEVIDVSGHKPRKIPPPTWRECITKIWEVDPLQCPRCAGEMKIIGFITEAPVIRKILEHLHLWSTPRKRGPPPRDGPEPQAPAQGPPSPRSQEPESFDDGWPGYEEPFITYD